MINLEEMQREQAEWGKKNFPDREQWEPLVGAVEELGELSHAFLKRKQGIRYPRDKATQMVRDGVGDVVIYLLDFCTAEGISMEDILTETWDKVRRRDWLKDPVNGGDDPPE